MIAAGTAGGFFAHHFKPREGPGNEADKNCIIGHICWNGVRFLTLLSPSMLMFKILEAKNLCERNTGGRGDGQCVLYISELFVKCFK